MSLVAWKPESDWDEFFNQQSLLGPGFCPPEGFRENFANLPLVNVLERPEEFVITAEVPGMKREDVHVEVDRDALTIKGETQTVVEDENDRYHFKEIGHKNFERRFRLGKGVDGDAVKAKLENGQLTLTVPKKEEAKKKTVEIKIDS